MVLELQGNPVTTLVCTYSPHKNSSITDIEQFYKELKSVPKNSPPHNMLALLSDLKAKLGPEERKFTYNITTNRTPSRCYG